MAAAVAPGGDERLVSAVGRALGRAARGGAPAGVSIALLKLLVGWLQRYPAVVAMFLSSAAALPLVVELVTGGDGNVHTRGLAAALLGVCVAHRPTARGCQPRPRNCWPTAVEEAFSAVALAAVAAARAGLEAQRWLAVPLWSMRFATGWGWRTFQLASRTCAPRTRTRPRLRRRGTSLAGEAARRTALVPARALSQGVLPLSSSLSSASCLGYVAVAASAMSCGTTRALWRFLRRSTLLSSQWWCSWFPRPRPHPHDKVTAVG